MWRAFFSFCGRLGRARFWLVQAVTFVVWTGGLFIALILRGAIGADRGLTVAVIAGIAALGFGTLISIAAGVKRLHDRNKSGWWLLPLYGAPTLLYGFADITMLGGLDPLIVQLLIIATPLSFLGLIVWTAVELGCIKGTPGPNTYGPDPILADAD